MDKLRKGLISALVLYLIVLPLLVSAAEEENRCGGFKGGVSATVLKYKIIAIFTILIAGGLGVCCLPIFSLDPDTNIFFLIRSFAAGVILATGFVHILPDATESLTSSCIGDEPPWGDFPITELVAMAAAIITLLIESFASAYMNISHSETNISHSETLPVSTSAVDIEEQNKTGDQIHVHTHASHGHSHGSVSASQYDHNNIRQKIVTQVLELGIAVHSVIIGISLGASASVGTIKSLIIAITFHQLIEGLGLGGCISQAKFEFKKSLVMVIIFSLTTPVGIGIGIGVAQIYNENSPIALMVSGFSNAAAAGILIYMALVDLVTPQFMNNKVQSSFKILFACSFSLLLGAGLMSLLALWA